MISDLCLLDQRTPLTIEFSAYSALHATVLAEKLSAAILRCDGWILERSEPLEGIVSYLVEFPCERSLEIYVSLVDLGIQLSRNAHIGLTRLWQCASHGNCLKCLPLARIRMTLQTASHLPTADPSQSPPCPK